MKLSRVKSSSNTRGQEINNKYSTAIGHIRSAIDSLGEIAGNDALAMDSIANLSVVLLDLSSSGSTEDESENA